MRRAFILMPFSEAFSVLFERVLVPLLSEEGFKASRADSLSDCRSILKDIVTGIAEADLIVADLTSSNANVFYELGIAHAMGRPTILLSQDIEAIPFDLRPYRVVGYSMRFDKIDELRSAIRHYAHAAKEGTSEFGNPISDYCPSASQRVASSPAPGLASATDIPKLLTQLGQAAARFIETQGPVIETFRTLRIKLHEHVATIERITSKREYHFEAEVAWVLHDARDLFLEGKTTIANSLSAMEETLWLVSKLLHSVVAVIKATASPEEAMCAAVRHLAEHYASALHDLIGTIERLRKSSTRLTVGFDSSFDEAAREFSLSLKPYLECLLLADSEVKWVLSFLPPPS